MTIERVRVLARENEGPFSHSEVSLALCELVGIKERIQRERERILSNKPQTASDRLELSMLNRIEEQ